MIMPLPDCQACLPEVVIQHTLFSPEAKTMYPKSNSYKFSILREPGSHFLS